MPSRPLMSDFHVWLFAFTVGMFSVFCVFVLIVAFYQVLS